MRKVLTILMAVAIVAVACVTPPAPTDTPTLPAPTDTPTLPKPTDTPTLPKPTDTPTPPKPTDTPTPPKPTDTPTPPKPTDTPTPPRPTDTPTPPTPNCTPGYDPCIPNYGADWDCTRAGGGNGPYYVEDLYSYAIRVTGSDPYGLDRDRDGWGCE